MGNSEESIGLLGGTFDPVHKGHFSIARSFLDSKFIGELWVVLTPTPPHKPDESITAYTHRKTMLELAFDDMEDIRISDVESRLPSPSYTIQTIEYLQEKYTEKTFYLCIGEDSLKDFTQWHRWEEILKRCHLLVAARPNVETDIENLPTGRIHWVDHTPIHISSTELRKKLSQDIDVNDLIPEDVLTYIEKKNLYT